MHRHLARSRDLMESSAAPTRPRRFLRVNARNDVESPHWPRGRSAGVAPAAGPGVESGRMTASGEPLGEVTALLARMQGGDADAREAVLAAVYNELKRVAATYMRRERGGHTLQPTALVHEAYLRLVDQTRADWRNRAQFVAVAAIVMRRILVNHARDKAAAKRGAGAPVESLTVVGDVAGVAPVDVLALDHALDKLAALDQRKSKVVELKYFGGMTTEETAAVIGVSVATVERDWSFARTWLYDQLAS